jgi:hypothetical protein
MDRASLTGRIWYDEVVPIFLERFLLYLCAGAFLGFVINNPMGLDIHQRIGLGTALVGAAYFLGHTAYKSKPISPSTISGPATPSTGDATATGNGNIANTGNGNTFNGDNSKKR